MILGTVSSADAGAKRPNEAAPLSSYLAATYGELSDKMRYVADYPSSYAAGRFFGEIVQALAVMPGEQRIAMLERWAVLGGAPDEVEGFAASPFAQADMMTAFDALSAGEADIATGSVAAAAR